MKNAIILFKGKEVCKLIFDDTCYFDGMLAFYLENKEVAVFKGNYSFIVTGQTSEIKVTITQQDISNSQKTPNTNQI